MSNRLEVRISKLIIEPEEKSLATYKAFFEKLKRFFEENKTLTISWEIPFNKILETILKSNLNKEEFKKLFQIINNSFTEIINISDTILGDIAFKGTLYEEAYKLFKEAGLENTVKYKKAKANYLLNQFEQSIDNLDKNDLTFLGNYFYDNKEYNNALKIFVHTKNPSKIRDILELISNSLRIDELKLQIENYLTAEAFNHNWLSVIELFSSDKSFRSERINDTFREYESYFLFIITKEIATDVLLPLLENSTKEKISLFLKQTFIDKSPVKWYENYYPEMIGCAIEKAGRDIDGLKFYEKVIKSKLFNVETKNRAKRRWIKVKLKQAQREESRGLNDKALKHKSEAEKEIRNLNINIEDFSESEFPAITEFFNIPRGIDDKRLDDDENKTNKGDNATIKEINTLDNLKFSIANFNINVLRNKQRINVDFVEEGYQVAILYKNNICKSIDVNFNNTNNENRFISEFLDVLFISNTIVIKLKSVDIELVIRME